MREWVVTAKEMRDCESQTGLSERELLLHACKEMAQSFLTRHWVAQDTPIVFLCGPGNNGADGFRLAWEFVRAGLTKVICLEISDLSAAESPLRKEFAAIWRDSGRSILAWPSPAASAALASSQVIVDGLFGFGLTRPLGESVLALLAVVNRRACLRVAIDLPSGILADTGTPATKASNSFPEIHFVASETFVLGLHKWGHWLEEGALACGVRHWIDLQIPEMAAKAPSNFYDLKAAIRQWPLRSGTANKSRFGRLLLVGGSENMPGALVLAVRAALRMGVGYVSVTSPAESVRRLLPPEAMWVPWKEFLEFREHGYSAVVIGPGLGRSEETQKAVAKVRSYFERGVLDADALYFSPGVLTNDWVITPHTGEMARLLSHHQLAAPVDRREGLAALIELHRCTVLLKGLHSLIGQYDIASTTVIGAGNVALAKGGTGDVLAGMIGSLMAQNWAARSAAEFAAFVHGWIADHWVASGRSSASFTPSDLISQLPRALGEME